MAQTRQASSRATPMRTTNLHCKNAVYTSCTVYFVHIFYLLYLCPIFVIDWLRLVVLCVCVS